MSPVVKTVSVVRVIARLANSVSAVASLFGEGGVRLACRPGRMGRTEARSCLTFLWQIGGVVAVRPDVGMRGGNLGSWLRMPPRSVLP